MIDTEHITAESDTAYRLRPTERVNTPPPKRHIMKRIMKWGCLSTLAISGLLFVLIITAGAQTAKPASAPPNLDEVRPLAVLMPTVTPTPEPTSTPDTDEVFFAEFHQWAGDAATWSRAWNTLLTTTKPGTTEWDAGHREILQQGSALLERLRAIPVPPGRVNMHGLAVTTFSACVDGAQAALGGNIEIGNINISVCTTGFLLLDDKIRNER